MKKACRPRLYDIPACILHGPGDGKQGMALNPELGGRFLRHAGRRTDMTSFDGFFAEPLALMRCGYAAGIWDLPAKYEASKTSDKRWVDLY